MIRTALGALLSHWRRRPGQLATLLIGLMLATALFSAVQAINTEARASYGRAAALFGGAPLDSLRAEGGVTLADYAALRRAGWRVSPVLEGDLRVTGQSLRLIGIDPLTAPALPSAIGAALTRAPTDILGTGAMAFTAPQTLATLEGAAGLPPLRAAEGIPPGRIIADIALAARLLGQPSGITRLVLAPEQPSNLPPIAEIAPGLTRETPEAGGDIARLTDSFHLNLTAFGLLSFAVGLFIVHGAIGLAFEQRRPMLRSLRALGVPLRSLIALLLAEIMTLALIAGALGVTLGYLVAGALLPDVAATLRGLYGAEVSGGLQFRPAWALGGLAVALGGAALASGSSLWRVAQMPLLSAAQPRAWARASGAALRRQALAGAALFALGLLASLALPSLTGGFALLAGLLIGAALILPMLLTAGLALGQSRAKAGLPQWLWADTRQQVPGLSLALMALLLALATTVGVGTMVSSFRLTFTGWLDQRLASELYVTARTEEEGAALRAFLAPRADAVLPIWSAPTRLNGRAAEVYGFADHPTYRDNWPILSGLPEMWDQVARGEAALVNEQLARRADLTLGQNLEILPGWSLPIAGIYSDYGNPEGQVMTSLTALAAQVPNLPRLRHGVRSNSPAALREALISDFGLPPDAITDQASIKAFSLGVFERTFTVTAALNVLTLGVAGFALLTAFLTLSSMRLPQLAPVWAQGITRRRLGQIELARSAALAGFTALLAIPLGLALAWVLLKVVNVAAFGWELPMFVFPLQWLLALGLAVLAALLAAWIPMRRLARTPPARFLQVFAHER
ncbi:ABC transporter permease [Alphaproteobacteria bacterium KMM 3653]|uniref:ABC transporter permease n=1 Tax=Harenicola maris TaxID=2841044 RepID=A0AAP2G4W2_9RHOB|nr:ABC transporter permease [Harenicola maris]